MASKFTSLRDQCNDQGLQTEHVVPRIRRRAKRGQGPLTCPVSGCGKRYTTQFNLQRHVEVNHYRLKRFECVICGERFTLKQYVEDHLREEHHSTVQLDSSLDGKIGMGLNKSRTLDSWMTVPSATLPIDVKEQLKPYIRVLPKKEDHGEDHLLAIINREAFRLNIDEFCGQRNLQVPRALAN